MDKLNTIIRKMEKDKIIFTFNMAYNTIEYGEWIFIFKFEHKEDLITMKLKYL